MLILLPLLLSAPGLLHLIDLDPFLIVSPMHSGGLRSLLSGRPGWIDPNIGFTTQALGHAAAQSWLMGRVPWWNPYTGIGVPLAAEMQPAALFLPFILLLHWADGLPWMRLAMQCVAGLATYELLRQLGLRRAACLVGGILFAFNGTAAWLPHGPDRVAAFLPLILMGIERARSSAMRRMAAGWALLAIGLAYSLYAGFPETAFLDGLFAGVWACVRLADPRIEGEPQLAGMLWPVRARLLGKLASGAAVALLISAPATWPFLQYLGLSDVGGHAGAFANTALPTAAFPMFLVPYLYGPIDYGFIWPNPPTLTAWSTIGGYVGAACTALGLLGLVARRERALRWVLAGWIVVCLCKTAAVPGVTGLLNLVPFMPQTAFFRYAEPSWELAAIVLGALAVDDWQRGGALRWRAAWGYAAGIGLLALLLVIAAPTIRAMLPVTHIVRTAAIFAVWAALVLTLVPLLLAKPPCRWRVVLLAALVGADAMGMFGLPLLSATRGARVDMRPIEFLRAHLGLQRFYSLGPIPPNYGALFGIASIDDNMLPIPATWARYVHTALDPIANPILFIGQFSDYPPGQDLRTILAARLAAYRDIAVRYIVTSAGDQSLRGWPGLDLPLVYDAAGVDIYEVPGATGYFSTDARCTLDVAGRRDLIADCAAPTTLVRRELSFPGWRVTVDGRRATLGTRGIVQTLALPAGRTRVRFDYAPPGIGWAYFAAILGAGWMLSDRLIHTRRRRIQPSQHPATANPTTSGETGDA